MLYTAAGREAGEPFMRLSKLHIAGFKSFPDRAELGFDHGVTAIVGPNGCGKSNVVDAITWVLGEQSAKSLRGDRMEDVIFSGSDARKPTAAAEVRLKLTAVAQAAMVVATADVDALLDEQPLVTRDVEIGRRLYRSGESEYLIDGEVCRLRDVHDLLMDSGLGIKAYAVIEQGKIGQILSSRPAERRALIEEAAGVTKYKSRRRAAELKLEAARLNLTRIDDIIFEVEKQRGALRRQAARARRYRRLREELRLWEQVQFAHRHEALARQIETADARLEDARAREAAAAAHVAGLESAIERLRLQLAEAESGSTGLRERVHTHELQLGRWQQQIEFEKQQIEELRRQAEAFDAERRSLDGRRAPAAQAIEAQRAAAAAAREALAQVAGRVEASEAEYRQALAAVQGVEQESDSTRAAVLASTTTLAALTQARDNAAAVRDRVAVERERLLVEARELDGEITRVTADAGAAGKALDAARAALTELQSAHTEAEAAVARLKADRDARGQALVAAHRQLVEKEARLRSLDEIEASRATFGDAARLLLAERGHGLDLSGAVADYLRVDRTYERAVDALLGDVLQHVIVPSLSGVRAGFDLLARREAGRCGFLVLDEVGGPDATHEPLVVPPGARALADVVHAAGPHVKAVGRLIRQALIVGTFEEARRLAPAVSVPVATMAGEVFDGPWLVEGGTRQDVRGILESRAETAALRESVAALTAGQTAGAEALAACEQRLMAAEYALVETVAKRHGAEMDMVGFEAQAARAADELARASRRREVVSRDEQRAQEEEATADARREAAVAAIAAHELRQTQAEGDLSGVLTRLQTARGGAEDILRRVTEARTEQAALSERSTAFEQELRRLEEAAVELDGRIHGRAADIERTEARREQLRSSIADTERQLDEGVHGLDRFRAELRQIDEQVAGVRGQFAGRDQEIRTARQALEAIRSEVMQFEVGRATALSDLSHLAAACLESVGIELDAVVREVLRLEEAGDLEAPARRLAVVARPDDDEETEPADQAEAAAGTAPPSELDQKPLTAEAVIADLKDRIGRLGPVNMMAIEQFDELETRHQFLTTQRQDLLDSIAQTGEAIRRIDKTTRERFAEAFEIINGHFQQTFATLFGGGRAGLILIDQENEPESGIDIIAQPPGKRLQNVQLLSGGEKALTAMALMFAIFKHRPSPFCLLDEIDAPLDDANIGRFIEMLQGMQEHTQFILITHNRKTMEIADHLYGVTMEEPGVSKLISVQLN